MQADPPMSDVEEIAGKLTGAQRRAVADALQSRTGSWRINASWPTKQCLYRAGLTRMGDLLNADGESVRSYLKGQP